MRIAPRRISVLAFLIFSLLAGLTSPVGTARADAFPIIAAGREAEILALAKPFALGVEITPGWRLENANISAEAIRFGVWGPGGAIATLRLEHPKRAPSKEETPSFSVFRENTPTDGGAGTADLSVLSPLIEAVRKNDNGKFWPANGLTDRSGETKGANDATNHDSMHPQSATGGMRKAGTTWMPKRRTLLLSGLLAAGLILLFGGRRKT